jgi:hypothetical protein
MSRRIAHAHDHDHDHDHDDGVNSPPVGRVIPSQEGDFLRVGSYPSGGSWAFLWRERINQRRRSVFPREEAINPKEDSHYPSEEATILRKKQINPKEAYIRLWEGVG